MDDKLQYKDGIWPCDEPTPGYDPYYDPLFVLDIPALHRMFDVSNLVSAEGGSLTPPNAEMKKNCTANTNPV